MRSTIFYTRDGRLDAGSDALVDAMLARLAASRDPRLLLFVHGGLVTEEAGLATAARLGTELTPLANEGWEIGFPIWRSGIGETIRINQDELAREPRFVRIVLRIVEWIDRQLGGGIIDQAFMGTANLEGALAALEAAAQPDAGMVEARLAASGELERVRNVEGLSDPHLEDTELAARLLADGELVAMLEAGLPMVDEQVRARAKAARLVMVSQASGKLVMAGPAAWVVALAAVRAGYRVLKRCLTARDHGLGPTVVEEVIGALYLDQAGAAAWGLMKRDARQHFDPGGAGTRLLEGLSEIARGGKRVRLLTIGHSAGSLFAGELARQAAYAPATLANDLILLAPAIRLDEAADRFGTGGVNGFRIFTMNDVRESANQLDGNFFGKFYHRSLLYLISGALETGAGTRYADAPLLGLERHLAPAYRPSPGERAAREALTAFLDAAPDRLIYAPSPPGAARGRTTDSTVHGGFWEDGETLDSIRWIGRRGFTD